MSDKIEMTITINELVSPLLFRAVERVSVGPSPGRRPQGCWPNQRFVTN
ncbi:hypothetical protein [Burkholderia sp. IDO3]|nr:hypothetical protein [Burkholderia sp. IDO3]